jgi:hypothetical protein
MSITYPLSLPSSPGFQVRELAPRTVVGMVSSQFTGEQQVQPWPGQWLVFNVSLPPMTDAVAGLWTAVFMALNGMEGTFYMGDSVRKAPFGTMAGTWTVGASAVANATTLPLTGGTGIAAVGDWLQVFTGASSRLHKIMQVNLSGGAMVSVDVFPRLRSAYANGSAVNYTTPKGLFRLAALPSEAFDPMKLCQGMSFTAVESL